MAANTSITVPDRVLIATQGKDALDLLQRLTTQDLAALKEADGILYALLLSPQGRYLFDFFVIRQDGALFIDAASAQAEALIQALNRYKLRADARFEILADRFLMLRADGPASLKDPRHPELGHRIWQQGEAIANDDYRALRVRLGIVEPSSDMESGTDMPLDFGLQNLNAISFNKGCYPGQEITARTQHRGKARYAIDAKELSAIGEGERIIAESPPYVIVQLKL